MKPDLVAQMEATEARNLALSALRSARHAAGAATDAATDLARLVEIRPDSEHLRRAAIAMFDLADAARDIERVAAITHRSLTFEAPAAESPADPPTAWPDRNLPA